MTWTRSLSTHQFVKMKYIFLFLITVRREKLWGLTLTFLPWHLHSLCKTFLERSWPTWHCCQDYSTVLGRLQGCLASSSGATKAIFSSKLQGRAELFLWTKYLQMQNRTSAQGPEAPTCQRPLLPPSFSYFQTAVTGVRLKGEVQAGPCAAGRIQAGGHLLLSTTQKYN